MLSTWKKYRLGDLSTKITKGTTPSTVGGKFLDSGINYIKSEAVSYEGRIDTSTFVYIDEETHEKLRRSQLEKDDILFSMAGIFLGKTGIVKPEMLPANTNQALAIIRLNKTLADPKFVQLFLRMPDTVRFVNNMSAQSAQPNINLEEVGSLELDLPPLYEQQAIAEILSAFDDKIELNHQMNKTLEEMANALYKHWFIDFGPFKNGKFIESELGMIPEGWKAQKLQDITEVITKGTTPTTLKKQFVQTGVNFIKVESITESGSFLTSKFAYIDDETDNLLKRSKILKDDVLITIAGTIGRIAIVPEYILPANTNQAIGIVRANQTLVSPIYLMQSLKNNVIREQLFSNVVESVQANLSLGVIGSTVVVVPDLEHRLVSSALDRLKELYSLIEQNMVENQNLEAVRDYLLPKLISGEIRVKDADKALKEIV